MSKEAIVERILSDAGNEADAIVKDAEEKAAAVVAAASARAEKGRRDSEAEVRAKTASISERRAAAARLDSAKILLSEKRRVIDAIYAEALGRMISLSEEECLALTDRLLKAYAEEGDENFKAPKDLELPFKVLSGSTAELGKHFLVKDEATSFIVPKDGNTATLTLLPGPDADLANPATLKLGVDEQGGRFVAGETASVTVTVKGLLSYAALAGTWHCKELIGLEMLELFAMEEDLDTSKVPSNNDDFTITITAGSESAKFTPSSTGDLANLFRTCDMTYTAPFNVLEGKVSGSCTTVGEQYFWVDEGSFDLTYFQLSSGNRSFDNSNEKLGKLTIALMLDKDGSMILFLRDFDQPPFLPEWWEDPFDPTFFGLGYRFEKAAQ